MGHLDTQVEIRQLRDLASVFTADMHSHHTRKGSHFHSFIHFTALYFFIMNYLVLSS